MPVHFIDTKKKLIDICQQFSQSEFLALDTEFSRQSTYFSILALLQISDGQQIAIIDPLAIKDLTPLMSVLYNKNITKVLHSARQDMEIFYYLNQSLPEPLFDTQICAALLGYGEQISYAALVKQLFNVDLDKSQTRTDWLKRPLSQKQIDYAADDVRYLVQIYPIQKQKLTALGRTNWPEEDFKFLSSNTTYAPSPDTVWKKIKGINKLKKQQLAILKNLAALREQLALEQNKPRRRVISDDALINLSINPPANQHGLKKHPGLSHKLLQHNSSTILSLIQKGLNLPDEECPKLPVYKKLSQNQEALANCLMAIVHLCAKNNSISPNCLCSRKELDSLIRGQRDVAVLSGWRKELLGNDLLKFLAGQANLSYSSGRLLFI